MNNQEFLNSGESQEFLGSGLEGDEVLFSDLGVHEGREIGLIEMGDELGMLPNEEDGGEIGELGWSEKKDREARIKMIRKNGDEEEDHRPIGDDLIRSFDGDFTGYEEKTRIPEL